MFVRIAAGFLQAAAGVDVAVAWRTHHHVVGPGDVAGQFVHGASDFGWFLVATPVGWLALWLFCEGLMRVLSAAMDQPFSTLPALTTVEIEGAHYAVSREAGTPERPHRYRLTPITPDHVVRTVTRYARPSVRAP